MNKIDISTDIQEFSDIEISDYSDATASENSFENILATNVFEPNLSTIRERVLNKNNNDDDDKIEIETEETEKLEEFEEEMPKTEIEIEEEEKNLSNRNEERGQKQITETQNQNLEEGIDDTNDKDEDIRQDEIEVHENKEQEKSVKKLLVKKNSLKRATREKTDPKLASESSSKAQMDVLKPNRVIIPPKIPEEPEDEYQLRKQFARAVEAFDHVQENHVLAPKNSVIEINGPDANDQVDLRQKKPILLSQVQKFSRSDLEKRVSNVTLASKPSNEIPEVIEDNAITNKNISPEPIINNAMDTFVSVFNNQNKHVSLINQPSNATSEFGIKESLEKIVNDVNQKSKKQPDLRQLSFFTVASFQNEPVPPGNYSKSLNINTVDPNKIGVDMRRDTISGMMSYQPTDQESSMRVQPNHIYQSIRNENENNDNIYEHPELTKAQTVLSVGTPFESHNLVQIQKSKKNPNLRKGLASTPDISMSFRELPSVPNDSSYNENPTMPSKILSSMSTQFQGTPHSEAGLQILKEIENTLKRKKSDNDVIEDDGNRSGEFKIEGEENDNSDSESDQTFAPKVQKAPKSKKFRLTRKTSKAQSLKSLKKQSKDNTKDRKTDIINEAQRKYATNKNIEQPRPNTPQINPALAKQIAQLNQKQKYSHFLTLPLRFLVSLLNGALFSVGLVLFIIGIWGSIDAKFDGVVDDIYIYSDPTFASLIFGGLWFWLGQKEVYFFFVQKRSSFSS